MDFYIILASLALLANLLFAGYILGRRPGYRKFQLVALVSICCAAWNFLIIFRGLFPSGLDTLLFKLQYAAILFLWAFLLHFLQLFTLRKYPKILNYALTIPLAIPVIFTGWFVSSEPVPYYTTTGTGGIFTPLFYLMVLLFVILCMAMLLQLRSGLEGKNRARANLITAAYGSPLLAALVDTAFFYLGIPFPFLTSIATAAVPVALGYALLKYGQGRSSGKKPGQATLKYLPPQL